MALGTRIAPKLELPPPFTLVTLREVGDAFAHAVKVAPEQGAGTLVYVGRFDLAEFAVVLEPDEPLRTARRAHYMGMTALVDALLAFAPPEKPIAIDWPDAIRIDGGLVGGGRLAWPKDAREDVRPDWLVFGGMIRTVSMTGNDPGLHPLASALEDEGFTDVAAAELVASFARHLMVHIDAVQEYGFGAVARDYLKRLPAESGVRRDIDENGDLMVRRAAMTDAQRTALASALAVPSWLDPKNRRAAYMKLIRTIRLDPSDTFVFERAAEPGEWAVSGAFAFWNADADKLEGKARSAFRSGFLGVESLGWSTLVQIVEASAADRAAVVERLAQRLVEGYGAPDIATARAAAEEEVAFAESLCNHPADTLIAVHRASEDGAVREAFRTLHPRGDKKPMRAFSFLEVEGEEQPGDEVDLVALAADKNAGPR